MEDIEMKDLTGALPTVKDAENAIKVTKKFLLKIMELPPELGVEMTNILRLLEVSKATLVAIEKKQAAKPSHVTIIVNAEKMTVPNKPMGYNDIVKLVMGEVKPYLTVTWSIRGRGGVCIYHTSPPVELEEGMIWNVAYTGNA